ncbi:MAG: MFS transporter [Acidobacteriota bacterium]
MFMSASRDPLFTPRFFLMCAFTFCVFVSAFQLFPVAPFRIRDLGGSTFAAGLFLAFLTYASAVFAPLTGSLADRWGRRRALVISGGALTLFSVTYGLLADYRVMLGLTLVHGLFWSAMLTASAAYMSGWLPPTRRAEGLGYWGLSSVLAVAVAPPLGFWLYRFGWGWMCLVMAGLNILMTLIAACLPPLSSAEAPRERQRLAIEWRILIVSFTLFLYAFGYGGVTSFAAMYADANGLTPKAIYLSVLAVTIIITRPFLGPLADRVGYLRVFVPCLGLIAVGLGLLAVGGTRPWQVASAIVFGTGFGTAYPVYAAYLLQRIEARKRGASFGALISAFDTGIGSGSLITGWIIEHAGYRLAFGLGAAVAAAAVPYFLVARRLLPPAHRVPAP